MFPKWLDGGGGKVRLPFLQASAGAAVSNTAFPEVKNLCGTQNLVTRPSDPVS